MTVSQTEFHTALLDPGQPVPEGLTDGQGRPAGRRFAVYRNNVAHSLIEALKLGFPTIVKLIGTGNFERMAAVFLREHPPGSPILSRYGAEMPEFLARFEPLAHLGYLSDVARLEQAIRASYHAADASPADPAILQTLTPDALAKVRFRLAPALQVVRSRWPIYSIRAFNLKDGPKPLPGAETVLILRPEFDPEITLICPAAQEFITQIKAGSTLGAANDAALGLDAGFDLSATLGCLLGGKAISEIQVE
jgi:hypothetical protein